MTKTHIEKNVPFHHIQTIIEGVFKMKGQFIKVTMRQEGDSWTLLFT
jgi:hypothetical protein